PSLEGLPDAPEHRVACLLAPQIRAQIWRGLQNGDAPAALKPLASASTVSTSRAPAGKVGE
ncbi:MAG TPA: hypothetical protein VE127_02985, partial [Solirubrobacteraceae bacterium]|nr:hypothetical protein [Solirubrobacteraceae bacterium]